MTDQRLEDSESWLGENWAAIEVGNIAGDSKIHSDAAKQAENCESLISLLNE